MANGSGPGDRSSPPAAPGTAAGERAPAGDGPPPGSGAGPPSPPSIQLPRGGGAIRGIGEKFAANPVTGTGSMTVPIATTPGRSGFGPELSLSYDSGAGNGPFGFGWHLSVPSISRKTDKGLPVYDDASESDVFILSGAEDLVPVLEKSRNAWVRHAEARTVAGVEYVVRRYRPRVEGLFARIERWTAVDTGEIHWRSITSDNTTSLYGKDGNSRIADPADPQRVFTWLICESHDDKGNAIVYEYAPEDAADVDLGLANERNRVRTANRHLKRIKYGNRVSRLVEPDLTQAEWLFEVVFDYDEDHYETVGLDAARPEAEQHRYVRAAATPGRAWQARPDPFSTYRPGFEVRTYRRCARVMMFHHIPDLPTGESGYDGLVRSTEFGYADLDYTGQTTIDAELAHRGSTRFASLLQSVTQSGYVRDHAQDDVVRGGVAYATYLVKSLPPLEFEYSLAAIRDEVRDLDPASVENLPQGLDGTAYQFVDLDGEGISGVLTEQAGAWYYKPNLGSGELGPLQTVATRPNAALRDGGHQLLDLAGDGRLDVAAFAGPVPGFYERTADGTWETFRAFDALPNVAWDDPNLRFVDLDGNGHADVLITEHEAFTWYPSRAEEGFGPARGVRPARDEERGPRLVLADGTQSIYLADMCGDGLTDLVRIRNGAVCYWPNLGYGRFGSKVTMDNSPWFDHPDQFGQGRLRLADIDGSGTTDVIYLGRNEVSLYFNQSGNRLSQARRLVVFPHVDNVSSARTADLLGTGTACLVWSSPLPGDASRPLRYVDLMGGTKPHLLVKSTNNLGAETQVEYVPSIRYYLADKRRGQPWITRLPFPVHVVERVVTSDQVSGNRFVTRYDYHHGYFDGDEREFRGFGRVEQLDTEEFAALSSGGPATNVAGSSHVPPVLTKTWFHTGMYVGRRHVSDYFGGLLDAGDVGEYYREPGLTDAEARALLLEDTVLPPGLTVAEEREACRALRGSMLRQEVYARDGSPRQQHPYLVTERNFTIRMLQDRGINRHGVFFTHERESLSYHYERRHSDPRVGHTLTLEVDDYGNVLKSAAVAYGRRSPDPSLATADQTRQAQVHVTYTENAVTNATDADDAYRSPLPSESRTFELTGLTLAPTAARFTLDDVRSATQTAALLDYEDEPTAGTIEKRPIEHVRTYYRRNDLEGPLGLGVAQSLALPYESYQLAFTPGLVSAVYGARTNDAMFGIEGGYVHTEGDANWWAPSGRLFYSPDPADTPAQELAFARRHFFAPHRFRDPFHTATVSTETVIAYDAYDLMEQETCDALGNRVTVGERNVDPTQPPAARHDYRVMQPALIMDPNRNRSEVAFDALGLVVGTAVMGDSLAAPGEGDSLGGFVADLTRAEVGFVADLTRAQIDQFLADPKGPPSATLLADATSRVVYDLTAYWRDPTRKQPAVAATLARETHVSEAANGTRIQVSLSYSDGLGREIQQKIQAEPGPVPARDATGAIIRDGIGRLQMTATAASPRWVGSGWAVFNNKGKPVRQYEPFFTDTHRFEFDVRIGVSPTLFYDPVERVVATLHPNHSWQKVVFDAWRQETWDVNDTVLIADPALDAEVGDYFGRLPAADYLPAWHTLRTSPAQASAAAQRWPDAKSRAAERQAAEKAAVHAGTATLAHADSLGRTFLIVAHNKHRYSNTPPSTPRAEEFHRTRIIFDIEGNQRRVIDADDRVVMEYAYDMLGNRVSEASMEAGQRWVLNDAAGRPLYNWDSRGHRIHTEYDQLRRPTDVSLRPGTGTKVLIERTVYGEGRRDPEADNLRGEVVELYDQAGVVTNHAFDFKGNLLHSSRQLAQAYDSTLDWSVTVSRADTYTSRTRYDALNRPTQLVAPHRASATVNVVQPNYNEANLLDQVHVWLDGAAEPAVMLDTATASLRAVTNIDYDAKGQRTRIDHGTQSREVVRTSYAYDHETFRLTHLYTRRGVDAASGQGGPFTGDCEDAAGATVAAPETAPPGRSCGLQNLHYAYDPVGNITHIRDDAQQPVFFNNQRVDATGEYTYDATYRLIEASGREHLGQADGAPTWHSYNDAGRARRPHPGDGAAMGRYLERYVYDRVGNFVSMAHEGTDPAHPGWKRTYVYDEPSQLESRKSNRLTSTTIDGTTETYSTAGDGYDAHGNMLRLPHLQPMQWDFLDQLRMSRRQAVNTSDADGIQHQGERTWYVYDSEGQRVRKVTVAATGQISHERIYLGGFEIYRTYATGPLVRETLHIMDDQQRIALVETRTQGTEPGVPRQLVRYQFGNHLGSASLELDDQAQIISYEEYTPYGSTSYQAVRNKTETPKRYRYTGLERDEETGLNYHTARYLAPWLGRWCSADPSGMEGAINLYEYANGTPTRFVDLAGTNGEVSLWDRFRHWVSTTFQPPTTRAAMNEAAARGFKVIAESANDELSIGERIGENAPFESATERGARESRLQQGASALEERQGAQGPPDETEPPGRPRESAEQRAERNRQAEQRAERNRQARRRAQSEHATQRTRERTRSRGRTTGRGGGFPGGFGGTRGRVTELRRLAGDDAEARSTAAQEGSAWRVAADAIEGAAFEVSIWQLPPLVISALSELLGAGLGTDLEARSRVPEMHMSRSQQRELDAQRRAQGLEPITARHAARLAERTGVTAEEAREQVERTEFVVLPHPVIAPRP